MIRGSRLDVSGDVLAFRRTKIVATVGPASSDEETLLALIKRGVNVFRMNFSHGTHEGHRESFANIKAAIARSGEHVAILGDLCGPKIRVGRFENGSIELIEGEQVTVTVRKVKGSEKLIPSEYAMLANDVKQGDRLLLADGTRELRVNSVEGSEILCTVIRGGELSDRKGINLPGVDISEASFTEKDKIDAELACELGVDYLALSFVRAAKDVVELKEFLCERNACIPVVSKIEKVEALDRMEEILDVSDVIMVARGDLGVEMPAQDVPLVQLELTKMAIERNKPVIIATQMLESMIDAGFPTRAEVTDVAWAAMNGADAVMLSGETAVGKYPIQTVEMMDKIVRVIEGYQSKRDGFLSLITHESHAFCLVDEDERLLEALARSAVMTARELNARAIAVCAKSGTTCRMVAQERPSVPIIGMGTSERVCARMALYWGVLPVLIDNDVVKAPWEHMGKILHRDDVMPMLDENKQQVVLVTLRDSRLALTPSIKVLID
ncbi:MAG: pyruvate kinase [Bradymonadales bacterium]